MRLHCSVVERQTLALSLPPKASPDHLAQSPEHHNLHRSFGLPEVSFRNLCSKSRDSTASFGFRGTRGRNLCHAVKELILRAFENRPNAINLVFGEKAQNSIDYFSNKSRYRISDTRIHVDFDGRLPARKCNIALPQQRSVEPHADIDASVEAERTDTDHS